MPIDTMIAGITGNTRILGKVNSYKNVSIIVDTGAAVSLIHKDMLDLNNKIRKSPDLPVLHTIAGRPLKVDRETDVVLEFKENKCKHNFVVMYNNGSPSVVLGMDFLIKFQAQVDYVKGTLTLIIGSTEVVIPFASIHSKPKGKTTAELVQTEQKSQVAIQPQEISLEQGEIVNSQENQSTLLGEVVNPIILVGDILDKQTPIKWKSDTDKKIPSSSMC